ncbi:LytTR family DNA-binding domain-containing protein [uncultured Veillonella sp.]|uniref:LytR/AlgR family response regulator transcription factor n=1 Tax=uncultured Veillonella sp. TaxID=159268 RepID=UPI0025E3C991|nr:LytTR family transcriptional regulator DNA-binding domain-containing protein [uncultured Veillonella sp.]MDY3973489.1 LytTR family transcriptional regulator DNA-binding domain-containing protein [Veillonella caviae]
MIRTILIDDEAPARDELRYLLTTHHADTIDIIGETDNATAAISLITREQPDLIFLDIHMHGLSGLELGQVVHDISPKSKIIFATAYDEYALKAFELQALDYVVKPIEEERLAKAVTHAKKALYPNGIPTESSEAATEEGLSTASTANTASTPTGTAEAIASDESTASSTAPIAPSIRTNKIAVDDGAHILLIDLDTISYITGESGRLEVHTTKGSYKSNKTLTELQERLRGTSLYRVHRSYIVNLNMVSEVVPWFKGTYWLRLPQTTAKGTELIDIPVSKAQVKPIKELLGIS